MVILRTKGLRTQQMTILWIAAMGESIKQQKSLSLKNLKLVKRHSGRFGVPLYSPPKRENVLKNCRKAKQKIYN